MPAHHALELFEDLRENMFVGLEDDGQLNLLKPFLLEHLFVFLLDSFQLSPMIQALRGRLVVYSMYRTVADICMCDEGYKTRLL